jgi:hypothetical protein
METIVILVVAAGLSSAVVWWASTPPGAPMFRRRDPHRKAREAALSFRETFQSTGPDRPLPDDGFLIVSGAMPDERPPWLLSLLRLAFVIGLVAALGVGVLALLGLLVKLQLDRYLGG